MSKLTPTKRLIGAALLSLALATAAPRAHALNPAPRANVPAAVYQADPPPEVEPAPELPPFQLPVPISEILAWGYSSSALVQLLRRGAAALDPKLGSGNGAALITLLVVIAGTTYGAANGALGHADGVGGYLAFGSLYLLAITVAYKTYIGKLLPDPPAAPAAHRS